MQGISEIVGVVSVRHVTINKYYSIYLFLFSKKKYNLHRQINFKGGHKNEKNEFITCDFIN